MRLRFSAILLSGCIGLFAQGQGDPFHDRSDTGEIVKVLPTPASIHSPADTQPTDAPSRQGLSVYPASYGSGNLVNHGGLEIPNASFQPIYWNSSVSGSTSTSLGYSSLSSEIGAFVQVFADGQNYSSTDTAADYTIVQQYGTSANVSATLSKLPDYVDKQRSVNKYSDSQIQSYLTSQFNSYATSGGKSGFAPSSSVLYGIYFPSGMKICLQGGCSCSSFCGYHSRYSYGNTQIKYAVFPYPNCTGCSLSGKTAADMLTIVSSHEIREAVTDPGDFGTNAWYDASGYEADDKCAWHNLYQISRSSGPSGFWVQPEYSNGGTVSASGFLATYPGPGCVVPR